jgi:hypothetical protein
VGGFQLNQCYFPLQVKVQKDQGSFEDFMECLKLYDKEENGTMLLAELEHGLKSLGKSPNYFLLNTTQVLVLNFINFQVKA